jgi:hypothetical protein
MNTELDERIRAAFDDIFEATPELGPAPSGPLHSDTLTDSTHRSWALMSAAAVVMIGIGGLLLIARPLDGADPAASPDRTAQPDLTAQPEAQPDRPLGQFVWPAPPRNLVSLDDVIDAFTSEVLAWPSVDVRQVGDTTTELGLQSFALVNTELNVEIALLAIPSSDGWGFVQVGDSLSASVTNRATISVLFQRPPGTVSSSVEVMFSDGTTISDSTTRASIELPKGRQLDSLTSVLVVHTDGRGNVIGVSGGHFASGDLQPPTSAGENTSMPDTESGDSTDSGPASVEAFCAEYASLQDRQPESYVGSSEHLADIDGLLAVAPDSMTSDLVTFRDYLSSGVIDSDANPDSTMTENWPSEVQSAIASTQAFAAENC